MTSTEIEEFAKLLVEQVRDNAISASDANLADGVEHDVAKRWRQSAPRAHLDSVAKVLIPDVVDCAVFYLLEAIDQGLLQLSFKSSDGKTVDLPEEGFGELAGWYMGSGGWRAMFSQERYVDDFADLA
jgi:hypothetical protein